MGRFLNFWALLCGLLVYPAAATLAEEPTGGQLPVRIGFGALKPYVFERDGKMVGVVRDTFDVLSERTNITFRYSYVTSNRVLFLLQKGDIDVAMFYRMPWLDAHVIPLVKISELTNMAIGLKGVEIASDKDLASHTVAVMRGGTFEKLFAKRPEIEHVLTTDYEQSVKLLLSGRVDVVIGIAEALLFNLQEAGIGPDQLGKPLVYGHGEVWAHISRVSPYAGKHQKLQQALQEIVDSGMNMQFRSRYLSKEMMALLNEISDTKVE